MKEIRKTVVYELSEKNGVGVKEEFDKQEKDGWIVSEWSSENKREEFIDGVVIKSLTFLTATYIK